VGLRPAKTGLKIKQVSLVSLRVEEEVQMIVGVWCRRLLRMTAEKWVGMWSSGMVDLHVVCLLARRSMPWNAGEVEGRMIWYLGVWAELGWDNVRCSLK